MFEFCLQRLLTWIACPAASININHKWFDAASKNITGLQDQQDSIEEEKVPLTHYHCKSFTFYSKSGFWCWKRIDCQSYNSEWRWFEHQVNKLSSYRKRQTPDDDLNVTSPRASDFTLQSIGFNAQGQSLKCRSSSRTTGSGFQILTKGRWWLINLFRRGPFLFINIK